MKLTLKTRETARIEGSVKAPPSKSYTHRAIIVGSMAAEAVVVNPLVCDDTTKTVAMLRQLGATIREEGDRFAIQGFNGKPRIDGSRPLNVGESGSLLRFILPLVALGEGKFVVTGSGSIMRRPNREIVNVLKSWGVSIAGETDEHTLPIVVNAEGRLRGGEARIDGRRSSQTVSALLMAAPLAANDTTLVIEGELVSRPYVDITIDVLNWAGVRIETAKESGNERFFARKGQTIAPKSDFTIHGDYSSATFLLAAAALLDSDVAIADLEDDSQGDKAILDILGRMGARFERRGTTVRARGPYKLRGGRFDCANTPDLVPALTTLACFAEGETIIGNVKHLAFKESNRITDPVNELLKIGADISSAESEIRIRPSRLRSGRVSSRGDHRIAMSLIVAGLKIPGGIVLDGAESISKSYPDFVKDMRSLGAAIEEC